PTAAKTINAVPDSDLQSAQDIAAKAAVALDKDEGGLAMRQAGVFERRPLINTGRDQQDTANNSTRAFHHRRKQRGAVQAPIVRRCGQPQIRTIRADNRLQTTRSGRTVRHRRQPYGQHVNKTESSGWLTAASWRPS